MVFKDDNGHPLNKPSEVCVDDETGEIVIVDFVTLQRLENNEVRKNSN